MLRLQHLSIVRGTRTLYDNVNLVASDGARIALVGENGSGKSSLFAAILGELSPESGTIDVPELVSEVAQSVEETDREALQYVLEGHAPLVAAQAEQFAAHESGDDMRIAAAAAHLAEINEGAVKAQALTIMNGLGFLPGDENRTVREFSGGWRNRLALARCLINPAQLLLLDEPTNHLDIDSLIWLDAWLKRLTCTVIIISHDREFLDRAVQTTWAVEDGTITRYGGNYSCYEMQCVQKLRLQEANRIAYERTAAHLKSYIERFRYKATKSMQVLDSVKKLEKIKRIELPEEKKTVKFNFKQPPRTGDEVVRARGLVKRYGDMAVYDGFDFTMYRCDKIALVGPNCAGKSTLLNILGLLDNPTSGSYRLLDREVATLREKERTAFRKGNIGFVFQSFNLIDELNVFENVELPLIYMRVKAAERKRRVNEILGRMNISHRAEHFPQQLSGGQQQRVAIARAVVSNPKLILADEPTGNLDSKNGREGMELLSELNREGTTVIMVTHSQYDSTFAHRVLHLFDGELVKDLANRM